ncbi:hypothetical protein F5888DRAFT_1799412 [Russula emetica]|nr:hypothetical protein F5888DRAFT_1799412 [Russula emetica]
MHSPPDAQSLPAPDIVQDFKQSPSTRTLHTGHIAVEPDKAAAPVDATVSAVGAEHADKLDDCHVAGKHEGWPAVIKSGHTALMRAVSRLNPQQRAVSLEYQGSSIGAPEALLNAPKSRRAATPNPLPNTLKILFPTREWQPDEKHKQGAE